MRIMKKAIHRLISVALVAVMLATVVPSATFAAEEDSAIAEEVISESILDMSACSVDPMAVTWESFLWPNAGGQYTYTYNGTESGKRYMLMVVPGIYKSLGGLERDALIASLIYIDQKTANGSSITFNGFIPARDDNSTVIISGEGMTPMIAGYISKNIFQFGIYTQDSMGKVLISDSYTVKRNTTWEEFKSRLPVSGYMEIYSDYIDTIYCPVTFIWRECETYNSGRVGKVYRIIADVIPQEGANLGQFSEMLRPFVANVTVVDDIGAPVMLTISKQKMIYAQGETMSDSDVSVSAVYTDGSVREVTGWTTNIAELSTVETGTKTLVVTYEEDGIVVDGSINLLVASEEDISKQCQIEFETFGGSQVTSRFVNAGEKLVLPEEPMKNGYKFYGWFTDRYRTKRFDENVPVEHNMTLYAGWLNLNDPVLYRLKASLDNYNILKGETLTEDMIKVTAVYDDGSSKEVDNYTSNLARINQSNTGTKTLEVSYTEGIVTAEAVVNFRIVSDDSQAYYVVNFEPGYDVLIPPQIVIAGEKASAPNVSLNREGYVFAGWYNNNAKWDFDTNVVNSNITLKAKWLLRYGSSDDSGLYGFIEEGRSYAYTGKAIKPDVTIMDSNLNVLVAGRDYTAKYSNNVKLTTETSKANILITGKGNYEGTLEITFDIVAKDIADDVTVSAQISTYNAYKEKGYSPVPTVKYNGKKLKKGTDFDIVYRKVVSFGSSEGVDLTDQVLKDTGFYAVVVTGKGNYTGTRFVSFNIADKNAKNLKSASIKLDKSAKKVPYTGKSINVNDKVTVKVGKDTLVQGVDYQIIYPDENIGIGKKTVTVQAIPTSTKYYGEKSFKYDIVGISIKSSKVKFKSDKVDYRDSLINDNIDSITIKLNKTAAETLKAYRNTSYSSGEWYTLVSGEDYRISYSNNQKAGKAVVKIVGIGVFDGVVSKKFTINKVAVTDEAVEVALLAEQVPYSKTGAKADIQLTHTEDGRRIKLKEGVDYTVKYAKNKAIGQGAVATITGKGNYSGKRKMTFEIVTKPLMSKDISVNTINPVKNDKAGFVYKPSLTILDNGAALKENKDFEVDYTGCITQDALAGGRTKGYVTVRYKENSGYSGKKLIPYQVVSNSIADKSCSISVKDQIYTGSAIQFDWDNQKDCEAFTAEIHLESGSSVELVPGQDFEIVSYSKNTACGKASIVVKGIGNYTGTKNIRFNIIRKDI